MLCLHFALYRSNEVGDHIGRYPWFATMAHAKGLSDKAAEDILPNCDSEEDFGSANDSELSDSQSQYESQSDLEAEDKLPMSSGDATTVRKKKMEGRP
jgi:hypothetical protein